jgi:hypothetical protein
LSTPWLVYSYIAFAVLILIGFLPAQPWQAKVIAASGRRRGGAERAVAISLSTASPRG